MIGESKLMKFDLKAAGSALWRAWTCEQSDTDFQKDADYQKQLEFARTFKPRQEGADDTIGNYEWVVELAKEKYADLHKSFDGMDEKADAIIKYLGGGTAIIALGALASVNRSNAWLVFLLVPSIVFALRAIFLATVARTPTEAPLPPTLRTAIEYAESYGSEVETRFLAALHATCEGLKKVVAWKSQRVTKAAKCYYRALLLLLLPLVAWPIWWLAFGALNPPKIEMVAQPTKIEVSVPQPQVKVTP